MPLKTWNARTHLASTHVTVPRDCVAIHLQTSVKVGQIDTDGSLKFSF